MWDSSRRAETHRESSNEALLRAELSSACPVQTQSRSPARRRVFMSAAALAITALLIVALASSMQVIVRPRYIILDIKILLCSLAN
jgi:hypothetical protein